MLRLLSILSWTILYVQCPITTPTTQLWGYYIEWEYSVYVCDNITHKYISVNHIIYHELWHMFQYQVTGNTDEVFAEAFATCWMDIRCNPKLRSIILNYYPQ